MENAEVMDRIGCATQTAAAMTLLEDQPLEEAVVNELDDALHVGDIANASSSTATVNVASFLGDHVERGPVDEEQQPGNAYGSVFDRSRWLGCCVLEISM